MDPARGPQKFSLALGLALPCLPLHLPGCSGLLPAPVDRSCFLLLCVTSRTVEALTPAFFHSACNTEILPCLYIYIFSPLPLLAEAYSLYRYIHSHVDGHLGFYQVLSLHGICSQHSRASHWVPRAVRCPWAHTKGWRAGSFGSCVFHFLRKCQTVPVASHFLKHCYHRSF